jgi:hypothetical protein
MKEYLGGKCGRVINEANIRALPEISERDLEMGRRMEVTKFRKELQRAEDERRRRTAKRRSGTPSFEARGRQQI